MLKSDPKAARGIHEVDELEDRIEKLKHSFELFFSGIENIDPSDKRISIRQLITRLHELHIKNPAVRFRFQSVVGRFVSLNQYWTRILKQIEDGTFQRDIFRANIKRRDGDEAKSFYGKDAPVLGPEEMRPGQAPAKTEEKPAPAAAVSEKAANGGAEQAPEAKAASAVAAPNDPASASGETAAKPAGAPAVIRPAGIGPRPAAPVVPAVQTPAAGLDTLVDAYIQARRKNNEIVDGIDREDLKKKLSMQAKQLKDQHQAKSVAFTVIVKDGKTAFKPIVKK